MFLQNHLQALFWTWLLAWRFQSGFHQKPSTDPAHSLYKVNSGQMLTIIITAFFKTIITHNHNGCHWELHSEGMSMCRWIVEYLRATSDLLGLPSVHRQGQSWFTSVPQNRQKPVTHTWDTCPPLNSLGVFIRKWYRRLMEKEQMSESEPGSYFGFWHLLAVLPRVTLLPQCPPYTERK